MTSRASIVESFAGLVALLILLSAINTAAQAPTARAKMRSITPNQPAPELYSDKISLRITLMNLPGAKEPSSSCEGEFKIYFVAEQDFEKTMRQLQREGKNRDLKPEYFPNKILLAEGVFKQPRLATLQERMVVRQGIDFKRKIPREQQTSFSSILNFYSVKVYDAKLKKAVYGSDVFVVPPFDSDSSGGDGFAPLSDLYLNLYVSDDGSLYKSNRKSLSGTTEWKPR